MAKCLTAFTGLTEDEIYRKPTQFVFIKYEMFLEDLAAAQAEHDAAIKEHKRAQLAEKMKNNK